MDPLSNLPNGDNAVAKWWPLHNRRSSGLKLKEQYPATPNKMPGIIIGEDAFLDLEPPKSTSMNTEFSTLNL